MITNWDQLPLVFGVDKMAELLDCDVETIRRRCAPMARGTRLEMRPAPVSWQAPYRWYREHVKAQIENRALNVPVGRPTARRKPFARAREIRQQLAAAGDAR